MKPSKPYSIHITHHFPVPATVLFDAWLTADIAKQWLFKTDTNTIIKVTIEPMKYGMFSVLSRNNDRTSIMFSGAYLEVDRPRHLLFTLRASRGFSHVMYIAVAIEARGDGCEFTLTQTGDSPFVTEATWRMMFQHLHSVFNDSEH